MTDREDEPWFRAQGDDHVSSFRLEALRLGAAAPGELDAVERHLAVCARCRSSADALEASHRQFVDVWGRTRGALRDRARARPPERRRWSPARLSLLALAPALAAVLILVVVRPRRHEGGEFASEPVLRSKGEAGLLVVARRGERVFPADSEPLRAGDRIRFVLEGVEYPFVMIASVDGNGRANLYVPYEGAESIPVPAHEAGAQEVALDGSIVLDRSPGLERVFALFSRRPLSAAPVRAALAAIAVGGAPAIRSSERLPWAADEAAGPRPDLQRTVLLEKVPE